MRKVIKYILLIFLALNTHAFAEFGDVDIHGFISQGYLKSTDYNLYTADMENGTFEFNEFGLNFTTQVTNKLRIGMQLVAMDLGDMGNDEIIIDWAFGDYRYANWLGLRAGKVKKPGGLFNLSRDIDAARTFIFLPSSIYNESTRSEQLAAKGISAYGTLPGRIDYHVVYGYFDIGDAFKDILADSIGKELSTVKVEDYYVGGLYWSTPLDRLSFVDGLLLGFQYGDNTMNAKGIATQPGTDLTIDSAHWIASLEYTFDDFIFTSEYKMPMTEVNGKISNDPYSSDLDGENVYAAMTYRFTDWFEIGTYYSLDFENKHDKDGDYKLDKEIPEDPKTAWLKDFAFTTRFDVNEYWIVKLEGHYFNGLKGVTGVTYYDAENDPISDAPDAKWFMFAAKVTFIF